jgi:hypothetical protein
MNNMFKLDCVFLSLFSFFLFYVHQKTITTTTKIENRKRQDEDDRGERKRQENIYKRIFTCSEKVFLFVRDIQVEKEEQKKYNTYTYCLDHFLFCLNMTGLPRFSRFFIFFFVACR